MFNTKLSMKQKQKQKHNNKNRTPLTKKVSSRNNFKKDTIKVETLCSPRRNNENFTCFTRPSLKRIIKYWNSYYPKNKLVFSDTDSRRDLWNKINTKLSKICDNDYCWLKQPFISDRSVVRDEFKPEMPEKWKSNKNEWLTTNDIEKVMNQYMKKHHDFVFIGAVPIDFDKKIQPGMCVINELCKIKLKSMLKNKISKLGIIFNLDPHDQPGSHWVSFYGDLSKGHLFYFDSYGFNPPDEVIQLVERLKEQGKENQIDMIFNENTTRHQYENSECGVYSIHFIENMLNGKQFERFCKEKIPDNLMEKFREKYYIKIDDL